MRASLFLAFGLLACSDPDRAPVPPPVDIPSTLAADSGGATSETSTADVAVDGCSPPCALTVKGIDVQGSQLVFDAKRQVLYTAAPGAAPKYGNELVVIDPATATVKTSVAVGSDPTSLAISEDNTTLWVGLKGAFSIRRVDLEGAAPTPGTISEIPKDTSDNQRWAGPMVVLPGTTTSVAISTHRSFISPSLRGVVIMDDGVARPREAPGHTGASRLCVGPTGTLFGYNDLTSGSGFYVLTVQADGLTQSDAFADLVTGGRDIVYRNNRVFGYGGEVIDVSDLTKPTRTGTFPFKGAVLPTENPKLVLMVSPADFDIKIAMLRLFDVTSYKQVSAAALESIPDDRVWSLVSAGAGRVAFIGQKIGTTEPRAYVVRVPFAI